MVVHAFIVGRLSSRRLPGKVLRTLAGRPVLDVLVTRLRQCRLVDQLILTTSTDVSDDPLAEHACQAGLTIFRGALADVAGRLGAARAAHPCAYVVRVNADSPFADPALIDEGVALAVNGKLDFVTNLRPRTYPYGIAVEVMAGDRLAAACQRMTCRAQREHPTRYFYEQLSSLRHACLTRTDGNDADLRLTIDVPDDLARMQRIIERLGPRWTTAGWAEVTACARATAPIADTVIAGAP